MKIHVLSDLHLEFDDFVSPKTDADVVVLAGDTHLGNKGILWAQQHFPDVPVVYVLGNHEYYRHAYPKLLHELQHSTQNSNVHVLENQALKLTMLPSWDAPCGQIFRCLETQSCLDKSPCKP
jgi:predicted phosphodiesterase